MYKKRIICILFDSFIFIFIGETFLWTLEAILNMNIGNYAYRYNINNAFLMILVACKDLIYKNKSICKKRADLEIRTLDDKMPTKLTLFLRNLTIVIWPIECLLILLKKERLGDIIFRTKVVEIKK